LLFALWRTGRDEILVPALPFRFQAPVRFAGLVGAIDTGPKANR